jgi:hypothetical protein
MYMKPLSCISNFKLVAVYLFEVKIENVFKWAKLRVFSGKLLPALTQINKTTKLDGFERAYTRELCVLYIHILGIWGLLLIYFHLIR